MALPCGKAWYDVGGVREDIRGSQRACASSSALFRQAKSKNLITREVTSAVEESDGTPRSQSRQGRRNILARGMKRFESLGRVAPPQPEVERLSDRVICILGMNPMPYTLNGTNCYLIGTGKERVLLDTGHPPDVDGVSPWRPDHETFKKNLLKTLASEQCSVSLILISHLHSDHFGGVESLLDALGRHVPVAMLPAPEHTLSIWTMQQLRQRGLLDIIENGPSPFRDDGTFDFRKLLHYRSGGLTDDMLPSWGAENDDTLSWDIAGRSKSDIQLDFFYMRLNFAFYESWSDPDNKSIIGRPLAHGEIIKVEGATLRCIFTPGHAENHASFALDEEHAIFSGDNVLGYGTTQLSELYDYMASLRAMQIYGPTRLYPGHGGYIADGKGLLDRYYAHRQAREDQVRGLLEHLRDEDSQHSFATALEIAQTLYVDTPANRLKQARENVEKILLKLLREGRVLCWKNKEEVGRTRMELPQFGYIHYMEEQLCWELKKHHNESGKHRHQRFIDIIVRGFGGRDGGAGSPEPKLSLRRANASPISAHL